MSDLDKIAADKALVGDIMARLPRWIEEAGLMADMAANSERSGMRADRRTADRSSSLVGELREMRERLRSTPDCHDASLVSRKRILGAVIEAIRAETEGSTRPLGAAAD